MADSEVAICNLALLQVGVNEPIDSLDEATAEARTCKLLYSHVRDTVLASVEWPFATRRAVLAARAGLSRSGWAGAFALPADCLVARYLWTGVRNPRPEMRPSFAIEDDGSGTRVLLCDLAAPELVYTARITDPRAFPMLFTEALAWGLSAKLAMPLAVKEQRAALAHQAYRLALHEAATAAANEGQADRPPESDYILARG